MSDVSKCVVKCRFVEYCESKTLRLIVTYFPSLTEEIMFLYSISKYEPVVSKNTIFLYTNYKYVRQHHSPALLAAECIHFFFKLNYSKNDASCEFDEFTVDSHLCELCCWYLQYIWYVGEFFHSFI